MGVLQGDLGGYITGRCAAEIARPVHDAGAGCTRTADGVGGIF